MIKIRISMRCLLLVFSLVFSTSCKTTTLPSAISEWIPFDSRRGHIIFDVHINGIPGRALLDSGAEGSIITQAFCEAHKIAVAGRNAVTVIGVVGQKRFSTAEDLTIDFVSRGKAGGGVPVQNAIIMEKQTDGVDLVLGLQFFRRLVVQIDYPQRRLRYMTRSATQLAKVANTKMKQARRGAGLILMEVEVNGKAQWVMLDTGNSGPVYLKRRTAQEEGWLSQSRPAGQAAISGVTRTTDVEVRLMDRIKVGPFELTDVPIMVERLKDETREIRLGKRGSRLRSSTEATKPGIIGFDVLQHFVVTIDYDEQLLHFE